MPFSIIYNPRHGYILFILLEMGVNHNFVANTHAINHDKQCC